jgi:microcystin-dependent protein
MRALTRTVGGSDALLTYELLSSPSPLQVSPGLGPPPDSSLTFVLSCPTAIGQVTVEHILFELPVGDPNAPDATDLTEAAAGIYASVTSSGSDQWNIGPGPLPASFVLEPASSGSGVVDGQGITVTINDIKVSPIVGTAVLKISERASDIGSPIETRTCNVSVPKFPFGVTVGNFRASALQVPNGSPVILLWTGSVGPRYTLLWGSHSPVDVSNVNHWTSPGLTDTAVFVLEFTAQHAGESVTQYFSATVLVADPDITAKSLSVLAGATVGDTLQVVGAISGFGTVPIGCVIAYAGTIANAGSLAAQGWLLCDGTAVSRRTYASLFAAIGTRHGGGDGRNTFNLPDYRGRFLRGTDRGAGRDPDISLRLPANTGGVAGDATGSIQPWASGRPVNKALTSDLQGNHAHTVSNVPIANASYWIGGSYLAAWNGGSVNTGAAGAHTHTIAGGGDNETRPVNAYVDYLIRFQ